MHISNLKQSRFLKKEDVGNGLLVTIDRVDMENVALDGEPKTEKAVLYFREEVKPLVLNSTNADRIGEITGSQQTEDWAGQKIVVYNDPEVTFGGTRMGGIRVRTPSSADLPTSAPIVQVGAKAADQPVNDLSF